MRVKETGRMLRLPTDEQAGKQPSLVRLSAGRSLGTEPPDTGDRIDLVEVARQPGHVIGYRREATPRSPRKRGGRSVRREIRMLSKTVVNTVEARFIVVGRSLQIVGA